MNKLYSYLLNTLPRPLLIRMSYVFRWFSPLIYAGNKVECPVCGKSSRKFLPYGSKVAYREGVLCPHDLTLERHRLMWLYLKNKSNFFTAKKLELLHIAPEQCFLPYFKKQSNLAYLTGDLESPIADMHFDLHHIPLEDNRFDVIFCNHVLEHVADDKQCMSELFRVMKPGGWGIFQVPLDTTREVTYEDDRIVTPEDRELHYWQKDHVRLYGLDYPTKLQALGFEVDTYDPKKEIPAEQLVRYRLNPNEILYIFRKPVQ
jgi:SAM-dependent methyltransferase